MDRYITLGNYAACAGLFCVSVLIFLVAKQKSPKVFNVWFLSGVTGLLLGIAGLMAAGELMGYSWVKKAALEPSQMPAVSGMPGGPGGAGTPGGGPGGGGKRGGKGPGGPGGFQPSPTRELSSLVRKLDLLTGDIAIKLTDEQKAKLKPALAAILAKAEITDDDAKGIQETLKAILTESQQKALDKIGLPRTAGGPRGGGPPGAGGNPFKEGPGADALKSLQERL